ncbi:MAG: thioredoxin domain-containing protein, partial [Anaerolineales bacterium]|nr:thioredoxin domain-containing protein [Anaerolineales bacterium]
MAHESFENSATAEFMNSHFINIKVDREERPDLDAIYMQAVVAMTGQGGWPMTVFLTPEGRPFYGGTYFPPAPRYGMPSFIQLMQGIVNAWETKRSEIIQSSGDITKHLQRTAVLTGQEDVLSPSMFGKATEALAKDFDHERGGFGGAPKFPPSMTLEYLLQSFVLHKDSRALHMAETTLKMMAYGGMYDQIGGGFARYSTDVNWLVPHFEK